ncbi:hypothetical protein BJ138DRAFT_1160948 [Hygrophoropsis aurantiaca]|uniref:Uncharacterized protein n=1 Tax=Hygrophoropsis aurantiaca TaxID=72124 RepID=A0ACB8A197_9AGAM|nr:hypothetical protein BJ138DRAFT_1160948 [Hygrophoropsis aurantiaca]
MMASHSRLQAPENFAYDPVTKRRLCIRCPTPSDGPRWLTPSKTAAHEATLRHQQAVDLYHAAQAQRERERGITVIKSECESEDELDGEDELESERERESTVIKSESPAPADTLPSALGARSAPNGREKVKTGLIPSAPVPSRSGSPSDNDSSVRPIQASSSVGAGSPARGGPGRESPGETRHREGTAPRGDSPIGATAPALSSTSASLPCDRHETDDSNTAHSAASPSYSPRASHIKRECSPPQPREHYIAQCRVEFERALDAYIRATAGGTPGDVDVVNSNSGKGTREVDGQGGDSKIGGKDKMHEHRVLYREEPKVDAGPFGRLASITIHTVKLEYALP